MSHDPLNWVGEITPSRLKDAGWDWWPAGSAHSKRVFDPRALSTLRSISRDQAGRFEWVVFLGVWCPDCQEQLPEFFDLVEEAGIPWSSIRLVGTGRDKTFLPWTERYSLSRLPTYVVLREGREIGRITENPRTTLAGDLAEIVSTG